MKIWMRFGSSFLEGAENENGELVHPSCHLDLKVVNPKPRGGGDHMSGSGEAVREQLKKMKYERKTVQGLTGGPG